MHAEDIQPGSLVRVPKGANVARPATTYLLHVRSVEAFASGAVQVTGEVRRLDGRPSTRRHKAHTLTARPERLEVAAVAPADLTPTPFGIRWVLREAGFGQSAVAPQRGPQQRSPEGFQVTEAPRPGTVLVRWRPGPGQQPSLAETRTVLTRYAQAIRAAGWHAETGPHQLTVTAAQAR